MANITIAGATYSNVPAIEVPKQGGGTATFYENPTPTLQTKTKTYTPSASTQTEAVTADAGYDGLDEVDITVNAVPPASPYVSFDDQGFVYDADDHAWYWYTRPFVEVDSGEGDTPGYIADGVHINGEIADYPAIPSGTTVTPTESSQTIGNAYYMMQASVTVNAIPSNYVGSGVPRRNADDLEVVAPYFTAPSGYYEYDAQGQLAWGVATPAASISGTSATVSTGTNTLTLSKTVSNTPQVSAGYVSSGTAGNSNVSLTANVTTKAAATITPGTSNQTIASGTYLTGTQTISGDANLVAGNIKNGTTIFGVTGTYSGGSSKNVQAYFGRAQRTANSYGATALTITVAKTGTYNVYWTAWRGSSSGTMGTNLHRNNTTGTNQQTWTGTYGQNITLTNQSYTQGDVLTLYATSGSNSRSIYVANLIIEEQ